MEEKSKKRPITNPLVAQLMDRLRSMQPGDEQARIEPHGDIRMHDD